MELEVGGVLYNRFTSATAEVRLDALANTFSFTAATTKGEPLPFKGGEACKVFIEGEKIITGFIEVVSGNYAVNSHVITLRGRDKTGDVVDSSLSNISDLKSPLSLKKSIQKILENIGNNIEVIDLVNPELFTTAEDLSAPEAGVGAFEFMERLARKRQVLLTSNADGNIEIIKTPGETINELILQNVPNATGNNVLSASWSYDQSGRYNVYRMNSTLNPVTIAVSGANVKTSDIVNQNSGRIIDSAIRAGRQFAVVSEGPYSAEQNVLRAKWEQRIREARGQLYTATMQGHKALDTGNIWQVNKVINVFDEIAGIFSEMLINSIRYTLDLSGGKLVTLSLVEKNAYNLEISKPVTQKLGVGFA